MGVFDLFRKAKVETKATANTYSQTPGERDYATGLSGEAKGQDIFKAYIPNFLYKPPYGMPRRVNTVSLKALSVNPYVFSVIKTLADEATTINWNIKVKPDFQEEGADHSEKMKEVKHANKLAGGIDNK